MLWMLLLCGAGIIQGQEVPKGLPNSSVVGERGQVTDDGLQVTGKRVMNDAAELPNDGNDAAKLTNDKMMNDTTLLSNDAKDAAKLPNDTTVLPNNGLQERAQKKSQLTGPVHYQSSDSMIMMGNGTAYLHGKGDLKYESMELQSDYIRMNMDSSIIYAHGVWDDIEEEWKGRPVFNDGKESYETSEITYNIKTQKGFIRRVVTQQGEGYIIADKTKKMAGDEMMMGGGQYTTCDNHDHPHFYLQLTKAKVKPGEYIASGPAYLVVGDVPLPVAIPFGFFPFTSS